MVTPKQIEEAAAGVNEDNVWEYLAAISSLISYIWDDFFRKRPELGCGYFRDKTQLSCPVVKSGL